MPIEFNCESCAKLLRVPDGTSGSSCECPACGELLEIPEPQTVRTLSAATNQTPKPTANTGTIKIDCPKCKHELVCADSLRGTKGQCRNCKSIFLITDDPSQATRFEANASNLVFTCPSCDQLFEGSAEMEGRKGKCHACGEVFPIKLKPAKATDAPVIKTPQRSIARQTPDKQPQPPTRPADATAQAPANLRIACPSCQGKMEVPASAAGQNTECPFCNQLLEIPAAKQPGARGSTKSHTGAARQPSIAPTPTPGPQEDVWADLGDFSGGASTTAVNPYGAAPDQSVSNSYGTNNYGAGAWSSPASTVRRGLTFTNAFGLAFETAFPNCLVGAVVYFIMAIINGVIVYGGSALLKFSLSGTQLDRDTAFYLAIGFFALVGIIGVCLGALGLAIVCTGALDTVRKKKNIQLFDARDSFLPMLLFLFVVALLYAAIALLPQGAATLAPNSPLILVAAIVAMFALFSLVFFCCLAPSAIADGDGPMAAISTSAQICAKHFPAMLGIFVCGILLQFGITVITCGIGGILLAAFPLYLFAAAYHLATK